MITENRGRGAALVVCLIVLSALTTLGISTMSSAAIEWVLARNLRYQHAAFEAAAAGIEHALASQSFALEAPTTISQYLPGSGGAEFTATIRFHGTTELPINGWLTGKDSSEFAAYHFEILSHGAAPRNASATLRQGFYIIAPAAVE